jgi:general secretion pathway protein C
VEKVSALNRAGGASTARRLAVATLAVAIAVQLYLVVAGTRSILGWKPIAASPQRSTAVDYPTLAQRISANHLFGNAPAALLPTDSAQPQLQLTLLGTIAEDNPSKGIAIIRQGDHDERMFATNGWIDPGTRLIQVFADRAVIERRGISQVLWLPKLDGLLAVTGTKPSIAELASTDTEEPDVNLHTSNYNSIVENADFLPKLSGGKMRGVKVMGVKDDETMDRIGLHEGDVILTMRGQEINSNAQESILLGALSRRGSVDAVIERGGQTIQVTLQGQN